MKPLAACVLLAASLLPPATARADARAHRLRVAGIALTSIGATLTAGGIAGVTVGALYPPFIDVHHGYCSTDCGSGGVPTNWPVVTGSIGLVVGAAALGGGIALLVVGKRGR